MVAGNGKAEKELNAEKLVSVCATIQFSEDEMQFLMERMNFLPYYYGREVMELIQSKLAEMNNGR